MAYGGMLCGAILLGAQRICLAGTEDAPPAPAVAAASGAKANPYSVITERNPFRLNPPTPAPEPAKLPSPDLPVVMVSGFMRTGDQWKVLLAVKTDNPDPHGQKLTSYLTLAEGDKGTVGLGTKQAVVELVKLYVGQEKVDILDSGASITLSMKDNGFESPAPTIPAVASRNRVLPGDPAGSPKRPVGLDAGRAAGNSGAGEVSLSAGSATGVLGTGAAGVLGAAVGPAEGYDSKGNRSPIIVGGSSNSNGAGGNVAGDNGYQAPQAASQSFTTYAPRYSGRNGGPLPNNPGTRPNSTPVDGTPNGNLAPRMQ